jgi:hypothetical protein
VVLQKAGTLVSSAMSVDMNAIVSIIFEDHFRRQNSSNNVWESIEQIFLQALAEQRGALGIKHILTLDIVYRFSKITFLTMIVHL